MSSEDGGRLPPNRSPKGEGIRAAWAEKLRAEREAWERENPVAAAEEAEDRLTQSVEAAARRFEREAIAVPEVLRPPHAAKLWQQISRDAGELYRDLVIAGDAGVLLKDLGAKLGRDQRSSALRFLRRSGAVAEAMEGRRTADGRERYLIVLRAVQ